MASEKQAPKLEEKTELAKDEITDPYERTYLHLASCGVKLLSFLASLKLEVLIFTFMLGYSMKSVTSVTMIMEKVCRVDIGYDENTCANLEQKGYETYKIHVETESNNYHLYHTLISFAPSVVFSCFIGPWSDRHGRKPPLIMALIGGILDGIGSVLCAYFMSSSVVFYLIPPLFSGFSGGFIAVFTVAYSYASDISTAETRTFKYALMEMAMGLGAPLGGLAGGWIFKYSGYVTVFSIMTLCEVFGLFWVLFMIKETRGLESTDTVKQKTRNLFRFSSFIESYKATAKKRPHKGCAQIWLLLLAMSIAVLAMTTNTVGYIYVYHLFNWSNTKYSTISSVYSIMGLITILISVPLFTKVFKFGDPTLGIIGSISLIVKYLGMGLAVYSEGMYHLGNLLGIFSSLASLAGRSRISKIVSKNDLGKVFSFISSAEGILPILATVLITRIFNASVEDNNAGLTFYIMSGLMVSNLVIFLWMAFLPTVKYEEMHEEEGKEIEFPA